jgi:hypothetical protein
MEIHGNQLDLLGGDIQKMSVEGWWGIQNQQSPGVLYNGYYEIL